MHFARASGILLHPTCLPSRFGIGDFGPDAYRFVDFLRETGQKIWQVLPLGPTGYGDSPYSSFSAFAGNPLLISPQLLAADGVVDREDLNAASAFDEAAVDFATVMPFKQALLRKAFHKFELGAQFTEFCDAHASWLELFVRFVALKKVNGGRAWNEWTITEADPEEEAFQRFCQFEFFRQWEDLKRYCHERGIRLMGDIPIYVAHDSADVWANPDLFEVDASGQPLQIAGVPPDYFSATGQLWGNPVYNWKRLEETNFAWWVERFRATLEMVDLVRLDHFRGFEAYWQVPASEKTAEHGKWVKAPGEKLFETATRQLGELPLVAENLGVITEEVEQLRKQFGFPGMSVLQFAFGNDDQARTFRPHNYVRDVVAYTGTHDNDTTLGWWESTGAGNSARSEMHASFEHQFAKAYLGTDAHEIHWDFIRAALSSVANTAIVPLQDVLGLGSEARMNMPASMEKNWKWRFRASALTDEIKERLKQLTLLYER